MSSETIQRIALAISALPLVILQGLVIRLARAPTP
jgi:hypothetical protein